MVNGSANAQQTQVTTGKQGVAGRWRWDHIIRCLLALEGALGRVRTPPAAMAALRSGLVDKGLVVVVNVVDDWGGSSSRGGSGSGDGGWRHVWLIGLEGGSKSQVILRWEGLLCIC